MMSPRAAGWLLAGLLAPMPTGLVRAAYPDEDLHPPPTRGGAAVEVSVAFYIIDFARMTSREESFDATAYLQLTWRDPRLAVAGLDKPKPGVHHRLDPGSIWVPRISFENALDQPKYHGEPVLEADSDGRVVSWVILSCKFAAPMNLRRFPFDSQRLPIRIISYEDTSTVSFVIDAAAPLVGADASLTDWRLGRPEIRSEDRHYGIDSETYSGVLYLVPIARRYSFYIWRVIVPLTLLAWVSFAVFWFEPVGLQPQISTCMATLIALTAFNFSIDFALPKVSYLSLIDRHALLGFGFTALAILAVTLIHRAVTADRLKLALRIQKHCRWIFPLGYLIAAGFNFTSIPAG